MISYKDASESETGTRLTVLGVNTLSLHELLTITLSHGNDQDTTASTTASNLLAAYDGHLINLFSATPEELQEIEGMDFRKACLITAINELTKRIFSFREEEKPEITSTDDVVHLIAPYMVHLKQEQFRVLLLDSKHRVIHHDVVSVGSLDSASVHPRDVFRPAVNRNAAFIFLVHNHPSGDPEPSEEDVLLTQKLCLCGKLIGIDVVDHVIIGRKGFASLKYRNLL